MTQQPTHPRRARRGWVALLIAWLALLPLLGFPAATAQTPSPVDDPDLEQTVEDDESIGESVAEVETGHVDLGPKIVDGRWEFMARDDTAMPPIWRYPRDFVMRVNDASLLRVPDDPQFEFLGIESDAEVYVIPQTQNTESIWLGWNTQDPSVVPLLTQGAELVLHDIQGPGEMHLFLTTGFDEPLPLWDSTALDADGEQSFWVDGNTHVHANWIFTEPGVYLVTAEFRAARSEDPSQAATATMMLVVGEETTTQEALDAYAAAMTDRESPEPGATITDDTDATVTGPAEEPDGAQPGTGDTVVIIGVAAGAAIVVVGLVAWLLVRRSAALRASVEAEAEGLER